MKVWITADWQLPLNQVGAAARRAEALGADCVAVADNMHDGPLAAFAALQATDRIDVATMGLVCFARSPMVTAVQAWDLQAASGGRFRLGLSPLIAPIMIQKYGVPWFPAASRMREYIRSLRAIFDCWRNDAPLDFRGDYYRLTRQEKYNRPQRIDHPDPPLHIGAIGPKMTALAGEMSDGIMTHVTNSSPIFLLERLWPNLRAGAAKAGRDAASVAVMVCPPLAMGSTEEEITRHREEWRTLLATLLSTPNYWPTLELLGQQELGERLKGLIRDGRWDRLTALIDDALLDEFVLTSDHAGLPALLMERYRGLASTICLPLPPDPRDDEVIGDVIARINSA